MLATKSKRPAIVVSSGRTEYLVDDAISDPDTFVDPIAKLGSILQRSDMSIIRPTILPETNWGILRSLAGGSSSAKGTEEVIPESAVKKGKLTFTNVAGSLVNLKSIAPLALDKKIQLAGYFEGVSNSPFKVAISAPNGVDGVIFAQSLATALGGKFRVTEKVWFVEFDAAAWRRGFASLFSKAQEGLRKGAAMSAQPQFDPSNGPVYDYQPQMPSLAQSKESRELALALLNQTVGALNDSLIEQTFAYPNTVTRLNLNNYPALKRPVGDFIRTLLPKANSGAKVTRPGQGSVTLPPNILQRIDANRPGELVIETNFRISVELNLTGPVGGDSREPMKLQIL